MECNSETLELLSRSLAETLSPEPEPRRHAEDYLSTAANTPNYSLAILRLVAEPSVDERIRQCAAVNLKNHLQTRCVPSSEKAQIKALIVPLMLSTTPRIQAHLSQTLAIIADHDLPMLLSALLPELNSSLQTAINANDFASVNGILAGVNSLFKTDPIQLDLKYFATPLLTTVESISGKINTADVSPATLCQLIEAQRLCFKIFYSLSLLDLPELFKDTADKWMSEFRSYLTMRYPAIEDDIDGEGGVSVVDELRIAVCENITYYMEKEEELFQNYLKGFVEAVCSLFVIASASPNRQRLSVTAIKFLTIVSTGVHHELLAADEILQQITRNIVIPTVMLRDEDEELFEKNYVEFIKRDMEGSDLDTRRRIAIELLKGIAGNYKDKITVRVSKEINNCLAFFAENPAANWKYKDCAIYLVVSFATKKASVGGALISTDLVDDVESFFRSVIVPELQEQDVNGFPMLKAAALKFFTMFRVLIPRPAAMAVLGDVVRFVGSDVHVVHSYAATCIEKLLLVKDKNNRIQSQARYTSMGINPLVQVLITNLFGALEKAGSEENEYVMRCMMRVLHVADSSEEVVSFCITQLSTILRRVCWKPRSPVFTHFVLEVVTILGARTCQNKDVLLPAFEQCVRCPIRLIFGQDNVALYPYAYQWLAQLCVLTKCHSPSPELRWMYMIHRSLLCIWERDDSPSLPTLVVWFRIVVRHGPQPNFLQDESQVMYIVRLAKKLLSSPRTEEDGFHILNIVIEDRGYAVVKEFIHDIWDLLIARLHQNASPRFVKCMLVFMSLFLVKHGTRNLVDLMNGDKGIRSYHVFIAQFWIPNLETITGGDTKEVKKLCAVASTKLICESPTLTDPAAAELWGKMLDAVGTLLSQPQEERLDDDDEADLGKATGYLLHYAAKIVEDDEDPLKELEDPKHFIVTQLATLSSEFPGRFHPFITTYLSPTNQAALLHMCNSYNLSIL